MVGQRVFLYVSERLRQIKQSGTALFGNTCVIAVGDFYQLPPVKQKCLYDIRLDNFFPLWSSNFLLVELNQIMRQKDDSNFSKLLNRLRVKKKTEHLLQADRSNNLESCKQHLVPSDTLHIFATNKQVDLHNNKLIATVWEVTETLTAQDFDKEPQTGKLTLGNSPYDKTHDYLPSQLLIGPKAKVMLIRNVDITIELVNGAMGTVIRILSGPPGSSIPQAVQVLFDNEKIGKNQESSTQGSEHKPINITLFEENLNNNAIRRQFPLWLAWACTTHKVHGITTDTAVVSMKDIFAAGLAYVALSRVTSINGLLIEDLDEDKIYWTEEISDALQKMTQYLTPQLNDQSMNQNELHVLLHNIQGLIPHIEDMRANSDIANMNFICLTETWLESNSVTPHLTNFNLIHKPRFSSYSSTTDAFKKLKSKKHGGVGIYVGKDQQYSPISLDRLM